MRKNIETIGAITFRLPSMMVASAMPALSRMPRRGFSDGPCPLASGVKKRKILSPASDCRMRGAPRNEAIAEDRVAAKTPASISHGTTGDATHCFVVCGEFGGRYSCRHMPTRQPKYRQASKARRLQTFRGAGYEPGHGDRPTYLHPA